MDQHKVNKIYIPPIFLQFLLNCILLPHFEKKILFKCNLVKQSSLFYLKVDWSTAWSMPDNMVAATVGRAILKVLNVTSSKAVFDGSNFANKHTVYNHMPRRIALQRLFHSIATPRHAPACTYTNVVVPQS